MEAFVQTTVRDTALSRSGKPIQLAVATIGADHFGDIDFVRAVEFLPQVGIPNVELMCWYPRTVTPANLERNRRRFLDVGLTPVSMHFSPFHTTSKIHEATETAHFLWMLQACRILGGSVIKFSGSSRKVEGGLSSAIEVFRQVVPVAEDMGISLVVENHFQNIFEFQEDYERIFSEIDSSNLGVCLDMGHFASSGVDMVGFVESMPGKIHHIDCKDCRAVGTTDFVRYGTGIVDFDRILSRTVELGFSGYIIVELPTIDPNTMVDDLRAGARLAGKYAS